MNFQKLNKNRKIVPSGFAGQKSASTSTDLECCTILARGKEGIYRVLLNLRVRAFKKNFLKRNNHPLSFV
jgi:hypothetical protein